MKQLIIFLMVINYIFLNLSFGSNLGLKDIFSKNILISKETGISIDNERIFSDVPAIEIENVIFIPIRFVAEYLDYRVSWNNDEKIVTILKENSKLAFKIGEQEIEMDNKKIKLMDKSIIYKDRAMIPYDLVKNDLQVNLNKTEAKNLKLEEKTKTSWRKENIYVKYLVILCWFFCVLLWLKSIFNMILKAKSE